MNRIRILLTVMAITSVVAGCWKEADKPSDARPQETVQDTAGETQTQMIKIEQTTAPENGTSGTEGGAEQEDAAGVEDGGTKTVPGEEMDKPEETIPEKVYSVTAMQKTMYAIQPVHVRKSYTKQSDVLTSLGTGQKVEVTGMAANGWMRIVYHGQDAFVYKAYLSEEKPGTEGGEIPTAATEPDASLGGQLSGPAVVPAPETETSGQEQMDGPGSTTSGQSQISGPGSDAVSGVNGGPGVSFQPGLTNGPGGSGPSSGSGGIVISVEPGPS